MSRAYKRADTLVTPRSAIGMFGAWHTRKFNNMALSFILKDARVCRM